MRQIQFLNVVSRDEAEARFRAHVCMAPLGEALVSLAEARGRVLAQDIRADGDVPGFDRASVDGFAVQAADTARPGWLTLTGDVLTPGVLPGTAVGPGTASLIATGGMLPRGADAVVMVEQTEAEDGRLLVSQPVAPGAGLAGAGSDMARGEIVLRQGRVLGSREIGMLAAAGVGAVPVWRRPRVAIFSTGNELVAPGSPIQPGQVYDSNAAILAAAVEELGGIPVSLGIVPDESLALQTMLERALRYDMVLLSGGTSKGAGDVAAGVVAGLARPGVLVHGVALKPGKPLCLAVQDGVPVAVLPGFPTSAIFTFHEFLAPVIRAMAGLPPARARTVEAVLPLRILSERGRVEYVMVSLMEGEEGLSAYPTARGSGAVTSFAQADGFFAIPADAVSVAAGTPVRVQLIGERAAPDLVVIGSQCVGLDALIGLLDREGLVVKALAVGSQAGLAAAVRGACDVAGVHLLDPETGTYNYPFLTEGLTLVPGYGRLQGVLYRQDDLAFGGQDAATAMRGAVGLMVNRNAGSGTRILIDRVLQGRRPPGYAYQPKSHNAVAAAVAQGRADWGVAIETVARLYGLGFLPLQPEHYDFMIPIARLDRPAVQRFITVLQSAAGRAALSAAGFSPDDGKFQPTNGTARAANG